MIQRTFKIYNTDKEPIRGDVCVPEPNKRFPIIVVCHGFKGFKDWGFFPFVAEVLCKKGFIVVKFNFSGSGIGEDLKDFSDLDRFRQNTYSKEIDDLNCVLDELEKGRVCEKAGYLDRIGLLGHSRGGGIAMLKAASDKRLKALVTWNAISHVDRRQFADDLPKWRRQGYIDVLNSRTGQLMPLGTAVLDDIEKNKKAALNIQKAAGRIDIPFLILHGEKDESVPVSEGREIFEYSNQLRSRFITIPNASHTFGVVHPFEGPTPELKKALSETKDWFANYL